ncbi:uncharacterized protein LOC101221287 [Cucumis sativus]|uniref:RRM domain-containing protein n=1 Tax=Cucumis sativus TaxID=3659 RepID=A0A0A0KAE7_CUCSA|nr:uncharacterized protein LOC101221287 [Cucumis sativus]KGN45809.1 hypothetical protein Csa_005005 [Cucumis sativus]
MGSEKDEQFAMFEEKVKRTVYVDNLSLQVTEPVLRTALDQFGTVVSVHFIPNYTEPINSSQCALVEMKDSKEAKSVITVIAQFPFMMSGMPRPVRARPAEVEMFDDRPVKPGRKISFRWLESDDPDFEVARQIKRLSKKHVAEAAFLVKQHMAEEEKLAKQQQETLKGNYKKYEIVDSVMADGTARRLAKHYNMRISDD